MSDPIFFYSLLLMAGLFAGFVNTIAGGGSALALPLLMLMGLSPDVANATNRVSIFLQACVSVPAFAKHSQLQSPDKGGIVLVTVIGGIFGAALAAYLPNTYLKPLLLGAMVAMAVLILIAPNVVAPPAGTAVKKLSRTPAAIAVLFLAGFYGGFVQAGVGFILIAAIAGTLRYDLVKTNAIKNLCTLVFTSVALLIFIFHDLVAWLPGLVLALGSMVGAHLSVKFAINVGQQTLKWFLLVMTVVAAGAALVF